MSEFNKSTNGINAQASENNATARRRNVAEFNSHAKEYDTFVEHHDTKNISNDNVPKTAHRRRRSGPAVMNETASRVAATATTATTAVVGTVTSGVVVVVGALVVTSTYVGALGMAQASFKSIEARYDSVEMEIDVKEWSEDLGIRISFDDYKITYKIPENKEVSEDVSATEPNEVEDDKGFFFGEYGEDNVYYAKYYIEGLKEKTVLKAEIIGNVVFMNDVLDVKTVTVEPYPVYASASIEDVYAEPACLSASFRIYEWTEKLRFELVFNEVIDGFSVPEPNGEPSFDTGNFTLTAERDDPYRYYIGYENEDMADGVEVTLRLVEDDRVVDQTTVMVIAPYVPASASFDETYRETGVYAEITVDNWTENLSLTIEAGEYAETFMIPSPNAEIDENDPIMFYYEESDEQDRYKLYFECEKEDLGFDDEITLTLKDGETVLDTAVIEVPVIYADAEFGDMNSPFSGVSVSATIYQWTETMEFVIEYGDKKESFFVPDPSEGSVEEESIYFDFDEAADGFFLCNIFYGGEELSDGDDVTVSFVDREALIATESVTVDFVPFAQLYVGDFGDGSIYASAYIESWKEGMSLVLSYDDENVTIAIPSPDSGESAETDEYSYEYDEEIRNTFHFYYYFSSLSEDVEVTVSLIYKDDIEIDSETIPVEKPPVYASAEFGDVTYDDGYLNATLSIYQWTETTEFVIEYDEEEERFYIPDPSDGSAEDGSVYFGFEDSGDGFIYCYISYANDELPEETNIQLSIVDREEFVAGTTHYIPHLAVASIESLSPEYYTVYLTVSVEEWTDSLALVVAYGDKSETILIPSPDSGEIAETDTYAYYYDEEDVTMFSLSYNIGSLYVPTEFTISLVCNGTIVLDSRTFTHEPNETGSY